MLRARLRLPALEREPARTVDAGARGERPGGQGREAVIVGITGSRMGATAPQRRALSTLLRLWDARVIVHGDCVGVDAEADAMANRLGMVRWAFPSTFESKRAWCTKDGAIEMSDPRPPLVRNGFIVELSHALVALPRPGSRGTWDAVRKARARGLPVVVIGEDGRAS